MAGATPWASIVLRSGLSIQQLVNGLAVTAHTPGSLVGARQLPWAGELLMLVSQGLFGLTFARSPLRGLLRQRPGVLSAFGLIVLRAGLAIHPELRASIVPGPNRTPILAFTETGRFYAAVYLVGQVRLLTVLEYILSMRTNGRVGT